jgi:hypothetical protein
MLLAINLLVASCGGHDDAQTASAKPPPPWQKVIREPDRKRLAGLWSAWTRSLNEAENAGMAPRVAALGDMAVADAAHPGPVPTAGNFQCRRVKLGQRDDGTNREPGPAMTAMATAPCTITERGGLLWFEQASGGQRIAGTLYPDGDRQVFLGSMALAGETGVRPYGADGDRDQVGVLRNIGEGRWRLELPWPMWQSNLDVIEIVAG